MSGFPLHGIAKRTENILSYEKPTPYFTNGFYHRLFSMDAQKPNNIRQSQFTATGVKRQNSGCIGSFHKVLTSCKRLIRLMSINPDI
jgi:hypothetical protein